MTTSLPVLASGKRPREVVAPLNRGLRLLLSLVTNALTDATLADPNSLDYRNFSSSSATAELDNSSLHSTPLRMSPLTAAAPIDRRRLASQISWAPPMTLA